LEKTKKGGCDKKSQSGIDIGPGRKTGEKKACSKDKTGKESCPGIIEILSYKKGDQHGEGPEKGRGKPR
jgi:hypothetical protein